MHVAARPRRQIKSELLTIRPCELRDVVSVVSLAMDEWPNVFPAVAFDPNRLALLLEFHLQNQKSGQWVLVTPDDVVFGFLGLVMFERPLSGEVVADEYWWYVDPKVRGRHGIRLVDVGEQWAKERGAVAIQIGVIRAKLQPLMERLGYHLGSLNFTKEL